MQNTDSSRFCSTDWIRRVRLLGQEVDVKGYICAPEGGVYRPKPENVQLQLSILPTRYCDAACSFCIAKPTSDRALIDLDALHAHARELRQRLVHATVVQHLPMQPHPYPYAL